MLIVRRWLALAGANREASPSDKWVVEPVGEGLVARAREFWHYRRVLWFLTTRSVKGMYEGMTLGIFWLFARPLLPILISTFIFGRLLQVPSDGIPYFLFFLTGMACWQVFETSLLMVTRGLDQHKGMLKKVYFPRLMAPASSVSPAVVYFGIYLVLLFLAAVYYLIKDGTWYLRLGPQIALAIVPAALGVVLAIGVGLWTCIWQVRHREVRYTLRYVTRFWFYLTPVIYPMSKVPPEHRWLLYANPMAPIVETFKWAVLGTGTFPAGPLLSAFALVLLVLASGLWYFNRSEAASIDRM